MIPAGYLLKRIGRPPDGLKVPPNVVDVCSVSDCVNDDVVDIESLWEHNSFGVANDPELLWRLARESNIDTSGAQLFYYEAYEFETESENWLTNPPQWRPLTPVPSGKIEPCLAAIPPTKLLLGYDVVVFGDYLEHSPLSCNGIAAKLPVNTHCLFEARTRLRRRLKADTSTTPSPAFTRSTRFTLFSENITRLQGARGETSDRSADGANGSARSAAL